MIQPETQKKKRKNTLETNRDSNTEIKKQQKSKSEKRNEQRFFFWFLSVGKQDQRSLIVSFFLKLLMCFRQMNQIKSREKK